MARSTPELWSSVSLCIDLSTEGSAIQAELLDQWLRLAQALPLSITITFNEKDVYKWNRDWDGYMPIPEDEMIVGTPLPTDVISVASLYSHQWESLDIFLPSAWAETLESTIGRIPNLRSLSLQFVPYNYSSYPSFSKTFLDAPKLRTATLDFESMDVGLPYHQLEKLTLSSFKTTPFLAVLEKCSNLMSCRIIELWKAGSYDESGYAYSYWQPAQPTSVQLPKLVSLEITSLRPSGLLAYLVAPALEDIGISLEDNSQIEAFSAFLNRSNIVLKRLAIIDYMPREENLLMLLNTLPNLSHLELRLDGVDRDSARLRGLSRNFFDYLRSPNTTLGTFPLPYLKSFKYHGPMNFKYEYRDGLTTCDEEAFGFDIEKMLLARWNAHPSSNGASQLQKFYMTITSWHGPSKDMVHMDRSFVVKDLIKEGMDLMFEENVMTSYRAY
ncbi:uncharacterized protein LACBIDRAFT_329236 [Laccaria bicolor S238N-H82]|uniref:Predicted protein n=1 Tax=Laccaria bicolor (strain S238N-H82 / ATCC MYA-4686) TaxID=486041 RepID=B0DHG6_LACBS|nr:uncharacterized protein LACBIDRAFT_329236 [Laccaria bicolor S238N-H82]EDR06017.1 predicted protein [Laccaria bicolor S238N-H82]|eukprot:XP_001883305.1 predicted protein [Laccaria bicolor S238N-H82]